MSLITYLRQTEIFLDLSSLQLDLIAAICTERTYGAGEIVFDENTTGDELYIITNGGIEIVITPAVIGKESSDAPKVLALLRRGQSFGEVALVDEGVRSAGARAAEKGTALIIIPRDKIMLLCETYPQLGYKLMRNLAADLAMKIRNTDLQIRDFMAQ
ncbi:MAG: cyclic nucleotide-binding domain-containing protein [Anaerolineae bacterium]|nr:cyclic nucleotide-binding domain-containing protein [Anaerolineae bacterium]